MRLLIDQNLSYRLVRLLAPLFPGTEHVSRLGLLSQRDSLIWDYARQHGFTILSQDEDFLDLSILRGAPPKVVLLCTGNLPSQQVAKLVTSQQLRIYNSLAPDSEINCLQLR